MSSDSLEKIQQASNKLTTASHTLAQKLYEEAAKKTQGAQGGAKTQSRGKDEGVVDADYEVVDEEGKGKNPSGGG